MLLSHLLDCLSVGGVDSLGTPSKPTWNPSPVSTSPGVWKPRSNSFPIRDCAAGRPSEAINASHSSAISASEGKLFRLTRRLVSAIACLSNDEILVASASTNPSSGKKLSVWLFLESLPEKRYKILPSVNSATRNDSSPADVAGLVDVQNSVLVQVLSLCDIGCPLNLIGIVSGAERPPYRARRQEGRHEQRRYYFNCFGHRLPLQ